TVAVKILAEEGCADEEVKSRFLQEARLAGNVTHDNVISIYDFGEDAEGRPFMVMEFLKGEDLRHAIKNGTTGDTRHKLGIALDIARALEHIHTQNIIHRDIKPDNVHITSTGTVKLMDFGISKTQDSTRTTTGVVMGTPYYMAPEQVLGKNITPQADVYAFGVLVFELMTGAKPIAGDTVERLFYQILQEPLNVEPMRQAGIPETVIDLVVRCTEKDAAKRPQGFGEVCARIRAIVHDWDTSTLPLKTTRESAPAVAARPPWLVPAIVAAMLVVLAGVYFAVRTLRAPAAAVVVTPPKEELKPLIQTPTGRMVLVPGGPFLFGQDKQSATLPDFYIDKTEVTNEAYARYCAANGRPMPPGAAGERPEDPIVDVTFTDAQAFAKWAGKRMPSLQEWEKAARGTDGRLYPWGNDPGSPPRANIGNPNGVMLVHSHPFGASPYGALNMLGNVWEWVEDLRAPSPAALAHFAGLKPPPTAAEPWYVIRGGSFHEPLRDAYLYDFATVPARHHANDIGFRCAKTP
ncbi:MAG TPA: bifunctional serine/threonine-protein kinase/formylglycine-generating enzyme family protein, partial [Bryobacteraceae bacterium]|nr:bifunctional serine/threonine-protein kinase/formylglycine-generating enzyme family protein [Bryobacteraceae bacterium]